MSLRRIRGVIFDWAGTTVDYGCMGPIAVLGELFKSQKLSVSLAEARKDMGLLKIDHIRSILFSERIRAQFHALHGADPTEADVRRIYESFEPAMLTILPKYSDPIPGIEATMKFLRDHKLKVGSTTGYTRPMMELLAPLAKHKGYSPDFWIASSEVPQGRPYPWMIFRNAEKLGVPLMADWLKVGDTIADIEEGCNAGTWSAGVLEGSSLIGLSEEETSRLSLLELEELKTKARAEYLKAGADFVINSIADVPALVEQANRRLAAGELPGGRFKLDPQPYKLFTPGPILTSRRVKLPMMMDWGSRETDYMGLVEKLRADLTALIAPSDPASYSSVIMQGSGTFGVESVITSAVPPATSTLLVLVNGQYGKRMAAIAKRLRIKTLELEFDETEIIDKKVLKSFLKLQPEITHVGLVHSETTTGILNPIADLCDIVKANNKVLIVDAISSLGAVPFDAAGLGADFVVGSSNKGFQSVPGFAFVVARRTALERCKGVSTSLSLDLFEQWTTLEKSKGSFRFTSPVHAIRSFAEALKELEDEGGIKKRFQRYSRMQKTLQAGMTALGFEVLDLKRHQGPIITTFMSPQAPGYNFERFYELLKEKNCVIYPGKLTKADTFRIGTIGDLTEADILDLLEKVKASIFW